MAANNISLHIGMSGMPAVLAQLSSLNRAIDKNDRTLGKLNTAMFQVATVLGSFSTMSASRQFQQMTSSALAATNAVTSLTSAMSSAGGVRGLAWGGAAMLAIMNVIQGIKLWKTKKQEAEATKDLAAQNERLAEEILSVVEAKKAEGKITQEQRDAFVAAVPNGFDRGLMDPITVAKHLHDLVVELDKLKVLDDTSKASFNLEKEKLELLFEQQQLIAETMKQNIDRNKATAQDVENYRAQLVVLDEILRKQEKLLDKGVNAGIISKHEGNKGLLPILKKTGDVEQERSSVSDPHSFNEQMTLTFDNLQRQFGTTAQIVARGFTSIIGSAVDGIADSITGLLNLTMTWGEALRNIGMSIIQGIIESFARMVSEWIVSHMIMKGVLWAFHAFGRMLKTAETTETIAAESAKTPILAVNAGLASTSSYGAAAAIGIAAVIALIAALAATSFATGGYTGDGGKFEPAGIVHRGEYVVEKEDVQRIGVPGIESMIQNGGQQASRSTTNRMKVAVFDDRSRMKKWLRSQEGRAEILDIVRKDRGEV